MIVSVFYADPHVRRNKIPVDFGSQGIEDGSLVLNDDNFREVYDHLFSVKVTMEDDWTTEDLLSHVYTKFQNDFFDQTDFPTNGMSLPEMGEAANVFPRSMMMGDVIRIDDDYYLVDFVGFYKLENVRGFNTKDFRR